MHQEKIEECKSNDWKLEIWLTNKVKDPKSISKQNMGHKKELMNKNSKFFF